MKEMFQNNVPPVVALGKTAVVPLLLPMKIHPVNYLSMYHLHFRKMAYSGGKRVKLILKGMSYYCRRCFTHGKGGEMRR